MAYTAQALNRNLEAYLLFGKAIAGGAAEPAALTYWQAWQHCSAAIQARQSGP